MPSRRRATGLTVVGGGPAALEAARAYRDSGGDGRVRVLSADEHPPYNRPPLTKDHLRGESSAEELPLEDESFYREHDIELLLGRRVAAVDPAGHSVRLADGEAVGFARCVLATGSEPLRLPLSGGDHPDLLHLRSRVDGERLRTLAAQSRSAVVIGSGFIGCEAAASLRRCGLEVVMVTQEARPQEQRLGETAAAHLAGWLGSDGVRVVGGATVTALRDGHTVVLDGGAEHSGDLVLVAAGVRQSARLAEDGGIDCARGRIVTDSSMRTSADDVLAAGDVALAHNDAAGRPLAVEHWGEALRMGEIAGKVAAGGEDSWGQAPGFWSEIGDRVLKYAAWGDGYDETRTTEHGAGAFTVRYARDGVLVGVLTHEADEDYETGMADVERGSAMSDRAR